MTEDKQAGAKKPEIKELPRIIFPRACGDDPIIVGLIIALVFFSPRMRG